MLLVIIPAQQREEGENGVLKYSFTFPLKKKKTALWIFEFSPICGMHHAFVPNSSSHHHRAVKSAFLLIKVKLITQAPEMGWVHVRQRHTPQGHSVA